MRDDNQSLVVDAFQHNMPIIVGEIFSFGKWILRLYRSQTILLWEQPEEKIMNHLHFKHIFRFDLCFIKDFNTLLAIPHFTHLHC